MKLDDLKTLRTAAAAPLPPQSISEEILLEKYAKGDEQTVDAVRRRVARALAAVEAPAQRERWEEAFLLAQQNGFILGGRINSAAGTDLKATLINCFVQPVGDSISGDENGVGIYVALNEAAETMRRGGGVGYDFSPIRPQGAHVRGTQQPRQRADVLHARVRPELRDGGVGGLAARRADGHAALRSSGHRGVHPRQGRRRAHQLQHLGRRSPMRSSRPCARRRDGSWCTRRRRRRSCSPPARTSATTARGCIARCVPRALWDQIMRSTYDHAEPGVVFIDAMNRDNNLSYCETIEATNPCGEQPLPAVRLLRPGQRSI